MTPASIFEGLRRDHRLVLDQIAELEGALTAATDALGPAEGRVRDVLELLERQFKTHMNFEEDLIYPAIGGALPAARASLEPLLAEHAELRSMLAGLLWLLGEPPGADRDEQVIVQLRDLVDLLRIHIRKEEAVVFRVAEQALSPRELETLASRLGDEGSASTP